MELNGQFRKPTESEQAILNRLLEKDFPGRDELFLLLALVSVKAVDENGSLELLSATDGQAPVLKRVPIEAEGLDEDGITVHLLLHVVNGRPSELEIFKEDGSPVKRMPSCFALELLIFPPVPAS